MPGGIYASIWTPRHTQRHYPRPIAPPRPPKAPYAPPKLVPYIGAFAGLPPQQRGTTDSEGKHKTLQLLNSRADTWEAEASRLEGNAPSLTLVEQLGQLLVTAQINVKALIEQWKSANGSIVKQEFRLRVKGLLAKHGHPEPSNSSVDMLFESYDGDHSGIIEFAE